MKRYIILLVAALLCMAALWADVTGDARRYIDEFAPVAVKEMYRSGVPASITLAQGMLESRYGLSRLATEGNNHFGIKCHGDWKGKTMKADDDRKGECFRVYKSAEMSYRDHSDFLRYNDRYKFLFDYKTTDYKAWAHGLKKAGYATDPAYPQKLINLVEQYDLSRFDTMKSSDLKKEKPEETDELQHHTQSKQAKAKNEDRPKSNRKAIKEAIKEAEISDEEEIIPASPKSIEEAQTVKMTFKEEYRFSLGRQLYENNGVPFVYAFDSDSYLSIAKANNLFLNEILMYNDLKAPVKLHASDIVYLQPKKARAAKGLEKHVVSQASEDLRSIGQRYAVKVKSLRKLNKFPPDYVPKEGDTVILR